MGRFQKRARLFVLLLGLFPVWLNAQWFPLNGVNGSSIAAMDAVGSTVFAGTDSGLYCSADNGATWKDVYYGYDTLASTINKLVECIAVSGSDIYVAGWGDIYHSADNGGTWVEMKFDTAMMTLISSVAIAGKDCFVVANKYASGGFYKGSLYRYSDADKKWSLVSLNSGLPVVSWSGSKLASNGSVVLLGSEYNGIFRSADNGTAWSPIPMPIGLPSQAGFLTFASYGAAIFTGIAKPSGSKALDIGLGVYRSSDGGLNWTEAGSGLPASVFARAIQTSRSSMFAGTDKGIFISSDSGATWKDHNTGLPTPPEICALAATERFLFAAQKSPVKLWRRALPDIGIKYQNGSPVHIAFKAGRSIRHGRVVTIGFSFYKSEKASVAIFDASGRIVAPLGDGVFGAGLHRLDWNAEDIPAGCYLARLKTESATYARTITVMR